MAIYSRDQVILWDLDKTLLDLIIDVASIRKWKSRLMVEFAKYSLYPNLSPMLPGIEKVLEEFRDIDIAAADELGRRVYDLLDQWEDTDATGFRFHDRLIKLFVELTLAGVPQAIVTNNGGSVANRALRACLPRHIYDDAKIVTREFGRRAKPSSAPLLTAISLLDLAPRDLTIVMIGDSSADESAIMELAPTAGMVNWIRAKEGRIWFGAEEVVNAEILLAKSILKNLSL
jgi:phosphoglycolate phosphatase-like HAD superfamily hydrolase